MVSFGGTIMELHLFRLGLLVSLSLFLPIMNNTAHIAYNMLPCKAKTSLGQLYVDLIQSFRLIGCFIQILTGPGKCNCAMCVLAYQHLQTHYSEIR